MRAGQYSASLCRLRKASEGGQDGPRLFDRHRLLEGLTDRIAGAEALDVPRVELAQVARRRAPRRGARRRGPSPTRARRRTSSRLGLAGAARPSSCAKSHGLPSAPRASMTAAAPVRSKALARRRRVAQAAGDDHRHGQLLDELRARGRSRACPCGGLGGVRGWKPIAATPASSTSRRASSTPSRSPGAGRSAASP